MLFLPQIRNKKYKYLKIYIILKTKTFTKKLHVIHYRKK